jgi:hypothetical protein
VALQELPSTAVTYAATQRREAAAAISAALRLWRRVGDDFDAGYALIEPQLLAVLDTAQERITTNAIAYIPAVLEETGQTRTARAAPRFEVAPTTFVGVAGDGLPTDTLAYQAVIQTKARVAEGLTPAAARASGGQFLSLALGTMFSDTGRGAEGLASFSRPVTGWVRMLTPPSCGRCVILGGKHYKFNQGFARHPGCDCRHVPASENVAGDLTTSPADYLNSLSPDDLRKALGSKANAQAWNDGADPYQLINAYRQSGGVRTAQVYGRNVKYTTEGVTRRGYAYRQMSQVRALSTLPAEGSTWRQLTSPRLMPETIYRVAPTKERADQMLRDFGWIV